MRDTGFFQLRRGIWEHVRDGRMSITEALAFIYIGTQADTRSGIWRGCAKSLAGELGIPDRTARDVLEKMERGDYIRRFAIPGRHACYPILVHKFLLTSGEHNGEQLNALASTSPVDLAYSPREQDGERNGKHGVEHGAAQKRIENRNGRQERKQRAPASPFALPVWIPQPTWDDFLEMRRALRSYPTEKAKALLVAKLARLKAEGHNPQAVLEQSTENSWKGLFGIKPETAKGNGHGTVGDNLRSTLEAFRATEPKFPA